MFMSMRAPFAAVAALSMVVTPCLALQDLGEIPVCTESISAIHLRTTGVASSARWTLTSGSPGVVLLSLSPTGPFANEIRFTVQYGSTGNATTTFYAQGLTSGLSQLTAVPDIYAQGRDTMVADILVDRVKSIELVDTSDAPLENNPNIGGGLRKFTDVETAQVSQFSPVSDLAFDQARTIRAKVELEGQNAGFPVHLRVFDVDDPADQSYDLDPNGTAGDDNLGQNGGPVALTVPSDTDGSTRADILLSTQPGDNFRVAAGCEKGWVDSLVVNGTGVSQPGGVPPDPFRGRVSDMVTVWRYLHLEVEAMGPVECNAITGTVGSLKALKGGRTQLKLTGVTDTCGTAFSLKTDTRQDEFIGGGLSVAGVQYKVVSSRDELITVEGTLSPALAGSTAILVDDDNVGGGPLDGDEQDTVPLPDLSLLQTSDDETKNVLAVAYVVPVADLSSGRTPAIRINTPAGDPSVIYEYDWRAHDDDPNFWTGYLLGAYQGPDVLDADPNSESDRLYLGLTDLGNSGSMVFAETIRDVFRNKIEPEGLQGVACRPNAVAAHEVIHLFDEGNVHLRDYHGLMSGACISGSIKLFDETIYTIRSAKYP